MNFMNSRHRLFEKCTVADLTNCLLSKRAIFLPLLVLISVFSHTSLSFAEGSKAAKVSLESHLHIFFPNRDTGGSYQKVKDQVVDFLESGRVGQALAISSSYLVGGSDVEEFAQTPQLREIFDSQVASLVEAHPMRLIGVCGFNQLWEDGKEVLGKCLAQPGMLGMKLRFSNEKLSDPKILENIRSAIASHEKKMKFVLIHMPAEYPFVLSSPKSYNEKQRKEILKKDTIEIAALVELARKFPAIRFVVAHSMNSSELINELIRLVKKDKLRNLWIETSFALNQFIPDENMPPGKRESWKAYAKAWREFGIDQVIFGSDQVIGQNENIKSGYDKGWRFDDQLKQLLANTFLTEEEKEKILKTNGAKFIEWVKEAQAAVRSSN